MRVREIKDETYRCMHIILTPDTVGWVLNAWFNDYVVGKSGQSTNPNNSEGRPRTKEKFANLLIANAGKTRNSQLIDTRN